MQTSTPAPVRVTGRVTNGIGRGVNGATVCFTDMSGAVRYARTNTFGYYIVNDLSAGDPYVVTVKTRAGLAFEPRLFSPTDSFDGLDFIAR